MLLRNKKKANEAQDENGEANGAADAAQKINHEKSFQVPDIYDLNFDFEYPGLEKPWQDNREKLDDYFNYGM